MQRRLLFNSLVVALGLALLFLGAVIASSRSVAAIGVVRIGSGASFSCARLVDDRVQCWGQNTNGELGDGTTKSTAHLGPSVVCETGSGAKCAALYGAEEIAGGFHHACILMSDGSVKCFGDNGSGQLGDDLACGGRCLNPTTAALAGDDATAVTAGDSHTCALRTASAVYCWGNNVDGRLGDGTVAFSWLPVAVTNLGAAQSISVGADHTCAVTSTGAAKCWGGNLLGQIGNGAGGSKNDDREIVPTGVTGLSAGVDRVAAGRTFSCALMVDGEVLCWGHNNHGQLGTSTKETCHDNATSCSTTPLEVAGLGGSVADLSLGDNHVCALLTSGAVECWGANTFGQLGNGTTVDSTTPVQVQGLPSDSVVDMSVGGAHSCAVTSAGGVKCWGRNGWGQLGNESKEDSAVPVDVHGLGPNAPTPTNTPTATPNLSDTPTIVPTPTSTPTPTPTDVSGLQLGDVDCDGDVTSVDATLILQLEAELIDLLPCKPDGDVNGDFLLDAIDAVLILQFIGGLLDMLGPPP